LTPSLRYKAGKRVRKIVTGRTKTGGQGQAPAAASGAGQRVRSSTAYTVGMRWMTGGRT